MDDDYEPRPVDRIEVSLKFPGALDPERGGSGWAFARMGLRGATVVLHCSDAANEDPTHVLGRFVHEIEHRRLPTRVELDEEEDTNCVLEALATERPEVLRFIYDNLENVRVEALVERTAFLGALKAILATLVGTRWERR